ncbi:hypothetical protein Hanom_Chr12g01101831 [Helianthus anomalus]
MAKSNLKIRNRFHFLNIPIPIRRCRNRSSFLQQKQNNQTNNHKSINLTTFRTILELKTGTSCSRLSSCDGLIHKKYARVPATTQDARLLPPRRPPIAFPTVDRILPNDFFQPVDIVVGVLRGG